MRCLDCGHAEDEHDVAEGCRSVMAGAAPSFALCGCPAFMLPASDPLPVPEIRIVPGDAISRATPAQLRRLVDDAHAAGPEVAQEDDGERPGELMPTVLRCYRCGRLPAEIPDIVAMAESEGQTADAWVRDEEGTLNPDNGHFACDECYIAAGMPSRPAPARWVAP